MENNHASASARVSVAREILSTTIKFIETEEIETRIKSIEEIIKNGNRYN